MQRYLNSAIVFSAAGLWLLVHMVIFLWWYYSHSVDQVLYIFIQWLLQCDHRQGTQWCYQHTDLVWTLYQLQWTVLFKSTVISDSVSFYKTPVSYSDRLGSYINSMFILHKWWLTLLLWFLNCDIFTWNLNMSYFMWSYFFLFFLKFFYQYSSICQLYFLPWIVNFCIEFVDNHTSWPLIGR